MGCNTDLCFQGTLGRVGDDPESSGGLLISGARLMNKTV
jgi:hypothetical protein